MADEPRTIAEAWQTFDLALPGHDPAVMRAVFEAGAGAALAIAYHYGFVGLRAEIMVDAKLMQEAPGAFRGESLLGSIEDITKEVDNG